MENLQILIDILTELKMASLAIDSENDLRITVNKYEILFLGAKFNTIYSHELHRYLKNNDDLAISNEEFLELIPIACKTLNMEIEPGYSLENLNQLGTYSIQLF